MSHVSRGKESRCVVVSLGAQNLYQLSRCKPTIIGHYLLKFYWTRPVLNYTVKVCKLPQIPGNYILTAVPQAATSGGFHNSN